MLVLVLVPAGGRAAATPALRRSAVQAAARVLQPLDARSPRRHGHPVSAGTTSVAAQACRWCHCRCRCWCLCQCLWSSWCWHEHPARAPRHGRHAVDAGDQRLQAAPDPARLALRRALQLATRVVHGAERCARRPAWRRLERTRLELVPPLQLAIERHAHGAFLLVGQTAAQAAAGGHGCRPARMRTCH